MTAVTSARARSELRVRLDEPPVSPATYRYHVYRTRLPVPGAIFADGFESGDTGLWSASTP